MKAKLVKESYHFERISNPVKSMGIGKYCLIMVIMEDDDNIRWESLKEHKHGVSYQEAKKALEEEKQEFLGGSTEDSPDVYFEIIPYEILEELEYITDTDEFLKKVGIK